MLFLSRQSAAFLGTTGTLAKPYPLFPERNAVLNWKRYISPYAASELFGRAIFGSVL